MLEGNDRDGGAIRRETTTSISGDFRFDDVVPGEYTVSEIQPAFMLDGKNVLGPVQVDADEFDFEVTDRLITSGGNTFGERGLAPSFSNLFALSSSREASLFVVLDGDDLGWVEDRGGWSDVGLLTVTRDGDTLQLNSSELGTGEVSLFDRSKVQLFGRSGEHTLLRIIGDRQRVTFEAAVDEVFAS